MPSRPRPGQVRRRQPAACAAIAAGSTLLSVETPDSGVAHDLLTEAFDAAARVGNQFIIAMALSAGIRAQREWQAAATVLVRCLDVFHRAGNRFMARSTLVDAAVVFSWAGDDEAAALVFGAARSEMALRAPYATAYREAVAAARGRLGEDAFMSAAARGAAMDDDALIEFVRGEVGRLLARSATH